MQQQYAASFATLLTNFVAVYQKIVNLTKEKTGLLVQGDVQKLEVLLTQETELLIQAGKLEKQRDSLINEWSAAAGWQRAEVTTQFIVGQLAAPVKEAVEKEAQDLKILLDELRALNKTNSELIEQALRFVNYSLEIMSGPDVSGMTYGSNGNMGDRQSYKVLDQKV